MVIKSVDLLNKSFMPVVESLLGPLIMATGLIVECGRSLANNFFFLSFRGFVRDQKR